LRKISPSFGGVAARHEHVGEAGNALQLLGATRPVASDDWRDRKAFRRVADRGRENRLHRQLAVALWSSNHPSHVPGTVHDSGESSGIVSACASSRILAAVSASGARPEALSPSPS
jgi:hypothetical protein